MSNAGALVFARYAYPPNELGYCGPSDSGALLEYGSTGLADRGLVDLAQRFEGAFPYLRLIAEANRVSDPLAEKVVRAYWVGNPLLEAVDPVRLTGFLSEGFQRRAGRLWSNVGSAALAGGLPHHNFHVFAVYPWAGLLRAGHEGPEPLTILDRCRIRWGRVVHANGTTALVRSRALEFDGRVVRPGVERTEEATVALNGRGFVHGLRPGDWVSLHWDWVCDRLSEGDVANLRRYTLQAANATDPLNPRPGGWGLASNLARWSPAAVWRSVTMASPGALGVRMTRSTGGITTPSGDGRSPTTWSSSRS